MDNLEFPVRIRTPALLTEHSCTHLAAMSTTLAWTVMCQDRENCHGGKIIVDLEVSFYTVYFLYNEK